MNGNTYEITWKQGSMEHSAWTTNEDDARWCRWEDVEPLLARLAKLEAVREEDVNLRKGQ